MAYWVGLRLGMVNFTWCTLYNSDIPNPCRLDCFEKSLWRTKFGRVAGVTTPDLNGVWQGTVNFKTPAGSRLQNDSGKMIIQQHWRKIGIRFETNKTLSHTISASVVIQAKQAKVIDQYKIDKRCPDQDDFALHSGTGILRVELDGSEYNRNTMEVTCYTDHGETGRIQLVSFLEPIRQSLQSNHRFFLVN